MFQNYVKINWNEQKSKNQSFSTSQIEKCRQNLKICVHTESYTFVLHLTKESYVNYVGLTSSQEYPVTVCEIKSGISCFLSLVSEKWRLVINYNHLIYFPRYNIPITFLMCDILDFHIKQLIKTCYLYVYYIFLTVTLLLPGNEIDIKILFFC